MAGAHSSDARDMTSTSARSGSALTPSRGVGISRARVCARVPICVSRLTGLGSRLNFCASLDNGLEVPSRAVRSTEAGSRLARFLQGGAGAAEGPDASPPRA
ncbi:hypothetical protein DB32_003587 [Sandaracinus amylolyticus]|uniref:Uncharacterized protein n=1 Tax=Sandaracinus amylolyticus TaxID=927083 RepID=A0A0F6YHZ8_9BACT|nr:hypothetical protein DB32_003587 [Sandaracinus amylolyticus]